VSGQWARLRAASLISVHALLAQLLTLLSLPLVARLYTPADFGRLAPFVAAVAVLLPLSTLRLEQGIPLAKRDGTVRALCQMCMGLALITATLVALAVLALRGLLAHGGAPSPLDSELMGLLPLAAPVAACAQILYFVIVRERRFAVIARAKLLRSATVASGQVGGGLLGLGASGLALASVAGGLCVARYYAVAGVPGLARGWRRAWRHFPALASALRRFPLYALPSALVQALNTALPAALIAAWYSPVVGGLYLLAQRLVEAPSGLAAQSLSSVYHADLVSARRAGCLGETLREAVDDMQRLLVMPGFAAALCLPSAVALGLGARWLDATFVAQALLPWLILRVAFAPAQPIVPVLQWHRLSLVFQSTALVVGIAALACGALLADWRPGIALYGFGQALTLVVYRNVLLRRIPGASSGLFASSMRLLAALAAGTASAEAASWLPLPALQRDVVVLGAGCALLALAGRRAASHVRSRHARA